MFGPTRLEAIGAGPCSGLSLSLLLLLFGYVWTALMKLIEVVAESWIVVALCKEEVNSGEGRRQSKV